MLVVVVPFVLVMILGLVPVWEQILESMVAMPVDYVNGDDDALYARACDDDDLRAYAFDVAHDGDDGGDDVCAYVRILGPELMLVHLMVELKKAQIHRLCLVPSSADWHKFLEDLHPEELYLCCYQQPVMSE
ncbi:hypothetical protein L6452_10142 [Arctium lappa]|uniref:Uncharacterized protein n=1 Tax=Arctium lappa TaxID=4217 RepID=A0ACB9DLV0_ARCLA|nr:hypothetical protein L6452_10142 [Arctium lappa]